MGNKMWFFKTALEASATLPNNFIYGNSFFLGSRQECLLISNPRSVTVSKKYYKHVNHHLMQSPSEMKLIYTVTRANFYSPVQANMRYFFYVRNIIVTKVASF